MSADVRKPAEWAAALGFTIADPDGWRHGMAKDFDEPITAAEFDERAIICTIQFGNFEAATGPFPKAVDLAPRPTAALNRKERDRLDFLRRRRDYLNAVAAEDTGYRGRDFDRQEAASLNWAIGFIEAHAIAEAQR